MKKFSILFLTIILLVTFNSCSNDDSIVIAQQDPNPLDFENTFEELYILEGMSADSIVETFAWSEVNFNTSSPITYELEGATNAAFDSLQIIGTTSGTNVEVTAGNLSSLVNSENLEYQDSEDSKIAALYFRVRAYLGDGEGNALEKFSTPVNLSVELPQTEESKPELYLVGDGTEAGWDPNNNNTPLFRDPENDGLYSFSGYFNTGAVKFVEGTEWAPQYGIDENNGLVYRETEEDADPPAITIETAGYYTIEVNLDDLTYTLNEIDESSAETYDTIGIVGDGTSVGWPTDDNQTPDIEMTQSEFDPHLWQAQDVVLTDGPFKFRANRAWDVSWGGASFPTGDTTGDDIQATAGTYDVWFNTLSETYILIPQVEE